MKCEIRICAVRSMNIVCINVMHIVYDVAEAKCQWGGRALFKRPVAKGKELTLTIS